MPNCSAHSPSIFDGFSYQTCFLAVKTPFLQPFLHKNHKFQQNPLASLRKEWYTTSYSILVGGYMTIRRAKTVFTSFFLDNEKRNLKQLVFLDVILGLISSFMSVINIFTHKDFLLLATALMAVLSFLNAYIVSRREENLGLGIILFSLKMFGLFTYFIIFGGTEGFSTIWLLLVPAFGMFAFGRKVGTILSATLFVELAVFFYTPLKYSLLQCDYTASFLMRFPVVYCCFLAIGYFLEYVREITHNEMNRLRHEAKEQARHDTLTGLFNRLGFNSELERYEKEIKSNPFALLFIDTDNFKSINDRYGHSTGDDVLKAVAQRIFSIVDTKGIVCRWGGDEFAVLLNGDSYDKWQEIAENLRVLLSEGIVTDSFSANITISIGGVGSTELACPTIQEMLEIADKRLYRAKSNGRNLFVGQSEQ